jgi:hypothetical protein
MSEDDSFIVEISFHKHFATIEVAEIYQGAVQEWIEEKLPSYLWPDGLEYRIETLDEYDRRKGPHDYE